MTDRDKQHEPETESDGAPAKEPTDDDEKTKAEQDEVVDEQSEQSMDGSDAPPW